MLEEWRTKKKVIDAEVQWTRFNELLKCSLDAKSSGSFFVRRMFHFLH